MTITFVESAFEMFDVSGTGSIDLQEFGALLRTMGLPIDDSEAQDLVDTVDKDMSGEVELDEFIKLMCLIDGDSKLNIAEITFDMLDQDEDGYVTQEDIAQALDLLGAQYTTDELQTMFVELGVDGGGTFDKTEFVRVFPGDHPHPWKEVQALNRKTVQQEAAWRMLDKNGESV